MYILPYIYQGITKFKWEEIMEDIITHRKIEDILKEDIKWIFKYNYKNIPISQSKIIEDEDNYYLAGEILKCIEEIQDDNILNRLIEKIISREEVKIKEANDKQLKKRLEIEKKEQERVAENGNGFKFTGWLQMKKKRHRELEIEKEHEEEIEAFEELKASVEKLKYIREKFNSEKVNIPVLQVDGVVKNFREVLIVMGYRFNWIFQLGRFIEILSNNHIELKSEFYKVVKPEDDIEPWDYFIFNEIGDITGFIALHTLGVLDSWYMPHSFEFVEANNMKVFRYLIETIYEKLLIMSSLSVDFKEKIEVLKNSQIEMLYNCRNQLYSLRDLNEVIDSIRKREYKEVIDKRKIGIFMDTANIYTPLKDIGIDFNKLLVSIYGNENMKNIVNKYCTLLFLTYDNRYKNEYEIRRKIKMKKELEEFGFKVIEIKCQTDHANQKDDLELQKVLDSHMKNLNEALILTGDGHFLNNFRKYTKEGIKLNIISVDKDTTANLIKNEFKEQLKYLNEYWDSINL